MSTPGDQLSPAQCSIKTSNRPYPEYPNVLKDIKFSAIHPEHGEVGSLRAWVIDKPACRDDFIEIMDGLSKEMADFALKLFDKYGKLRPELVENEYHKGSGCWGRELNDGIIIYVVSVRVEPQVSRFGTRSACANMKFLVP